MATAARSRGFPNLNMPPGSSDKAQQPVGSAFPGSNLYPNSNIWTPSHSGRERPIGSKDSDDSHGLAASPDADVWVSSSNPWAAELTGRSVSTSPSRTRDGAIPNGSSYFDHQPAAIGTKKGSFGSGSFHDDANGYGAPFSSHRRNPQEPAGYMDAMTGFSHSRDSSLPPSRHSQGSPAALQDLYRGGPAPTSSMHSQRQMASHAAAFSTQSANQRAFNFNKQIEDDLSAQLSRRMALDGPAAASVSFNNPTPQTFQLNPGSQPWVGPGDGLRYAGGLDFASDAMTAPYPGLRRPSGDRASPAPSYRLESGNGTRPYAPATDTWVARPSSRDPRSADFGRRATPGQYGPSFAPTSFPNQFAAYANVAAPYTPAAFIDPYGQTFRHSAVVPGYGLATIPAGYPLLPPVRPSRDHDSGKGLRSAVLEDYRQTRLSKRHELKDVWNHVVEFSGDQYGSRFIQQKLETANSDEKDQVFREIEPNAVQLMKDVFGNYVVQKFFEHGNQVQKKVLADKMKGKMVDFSVQVYACRVVQKALEHVLLDQQVELTKELEADALNVVKDQNGNHVVQKIIELVPRKYIDFIMDALRGQMVELAKHSFGCRVLQRMMEHGTDADRADMLVELHPAANSLFSDQFGNYVAQHVIENGKPEDRQKMIEAVMPQALHLSKHKYASNVVEKCLQYGTPETRTYYRKQLMTSGSDGTSSLQQVMRDQYGNYVIQKLLGQLQGAEREELVKEIKPQFFALKKNGSTRQLQALEKLLGLGGSNSASANKNGGGGASAKEGETMNAAAPNADAGSAEGTPVLTDGTSLESASPRSTLTSAADVAGIDGPRGPSGDKATERMTAASRADEA